ncbi:MAG: hypothetical protein RR557_06915 [Bacilli bacterium]
MNSNNDIVIWDSPNGISIPSNELLPNIIESSATQLKPIEKRNVVIALNNGLFDMTSEYIWNRTLSILKDKVLSLGSEFVLEMLNRSLDEDISNVSGNEFIILASELGFINTLARDKLLHANDLINYFQSRNAEEAMSSYDMQTIVIPCIQYVVGLDVNDFSLSFNNFREQLKNIVLTQNSEIYTTLLISPYFYKKTTVKTLINLLTTSEGGELERVLSNTSLVLSGIWDGLTSDDKYTIGTTYSIAVSNNNQQISSSLRRVLKEKGGFDYVPENLRSQSFIQYANKLKDAHFSFDNFYNEPGPAKDLSGMGTIPIPAISYCISAVLLSTVGNFYSVSRNAQPYNEKTFDGVSLNRWEYYFNEYFMNDTDLLFKLASYERPLSNWMNLVANRSDVFSALSISNVDVKNLIMASLEGRKAPVKSIAKKIYANIKK